MPKKNAEIPQSPPAKKSKAGFVVSFFSILIIGVILVAAGTIMTDQKKTFESGLADLEQKADELKKQLADKDAKINDISAWNDAVYKVFSCESALMADVEKVTPDADALKTLGLEPLLTENYKVSAICADKLAGKIAFILSREELTTPEEGAEPACKDSCDKIVFGTIDIKTKALNYKNSANHLGIYSETDNQRCLLDSVIAGTDAVSDKVLFYCGSQKNDKMTDWYHYDLSNDTLTLVQHLTKSNKFEIQNAEMLTLFKFKSNAEMP